MVTKHALSILFVFGFNNLKTSESACRTVEEIVDAWDQNPNWSLEKRYTFSSSNPQIPGDRFLHGTQNFNLSCHLRHGRPLAR